MKITVVALLALSMAVSAGFVEFGAHAGALFPSGDGGDAFSTSLIFGVNILAHMPVYAIEGSIGYGILQPENDSLDFSASLIPILAGIRTYSGPIFYGGGAGMYISSVSIGSVDTNSEDFGAYGNLGMIFPAGSMDIEGSIKYHLVDFDTDKAWFALTVGTYF
ncbi:MAG: hypothetical protein KAT09_09360 [Candidatus Aegiribacteria sp.]|nr:hypothetical protein [Candidatus Aegiribacteria sp.]